jgi:hypothetical protein
MPASIQPGVVDMQHDREPNEDRFMVRSMALTRGASANA